MKCEECPNKMSLVCIECEEKLCAPCAKTLHSGGKRIFHLIKKSCNDCPKVSSVNCSTCNSSLCHECYSLHAGHSLSLTRTKNVYWDFSFPLRFFENFQQSEKVRKITAKVMESSPNLVRLFGRNLQKVKEGLGECKIVESSEGFLEGFKRNVEKDAEFGVNQVLVITKSSKAVRDLINSINTSVEIFLLDTDSLKVTRQGSLLLVEYLLKVCNKGKIISNYKKLCAKFQNKFEISEEDFGKICENLERKGKIVVFTRQFGEYKLKQISLRLKSIDPFAFVSVLRSLKLEEIFPSEKAIQSRIREAFDLKFSNQEWESLLAQLKAYRSPSNFTFFSEASESFFIFSSIPYEEEITFAIYPRGEEWASSDQFGDNSSIKLSEEWRFMLKFLEKFFRKDGKVNTMTGGKYGCAALIKNFAGGRLSEMSIGKISYMVQIALNQDVIRYQKTLLIWTANYPIVLSPSAITNRLSLIG